MTQASRIKLEIIQKIETLSQAKLVQVLSFVNNMDSDKERRKRILSFAGAWDELPQDTFDELTTDLHNRRALDTREF